MDDGIAAILRALQTTLSDPSLGEVQLQACESKAGFGICLCAIAARREVDEYTRQLACIVLKKFIKARWHDTTAPEKLSIRQSLFAALSDPSSKVAGSVGMALAAIAKVESDPELILGLVSLINAGTSQEHGE